MDYEVDINTVIDIYTELADRVCDGESGFDSLNEYERTILVTQAVEGEVNNGGFIQFFDNSMGALAGETAAAFQRIGAKKTAAICRRALKVFPEGLPADWEERRAYLDEHVTEAVEEKLEKCDDAFYMYEDDLEALNVAYVREHMDQFDLLI